MTKSKPLTPVISSIGVHYIDTGVVITKYRRFAGVKDALGVVSFIGLFYAAYVLACML